MSKQRYAMDALCKVLVITCAGLATAGANMG